MATLLALAFIAQQKGIREALALQIGRLWDDAGLDDASAEAFIVAAVAADRAARAESVAATDAYLATAIGLALGQTPELLGLDPAAYTRGVPDELVWGRPFAAARTARARGATWAEALGTGRARALNLASTNVQLASRGASRDGMRRKGVAGYRRVLGPGENCGLCIVASTQRYRTADLMPIHPNCGCAVQPIVGSRDPGQVLGERTLQFVYSEADGTTRAALGRLRIDTADLPDVEIVDHGELGPLLWNRRYSFATL